MDAGMCADDLIEPFAGDLKNLRLRQSLDGRMPLMVGEKAEFPEEVSLLQAADERLFALRGLFENTDFSPADNHEGVSWISILTDRLLILEGLDMDLEDQGLELLVLEFGEKGDLGKGMDGFCFLKLLAIKLGQPVIHIFQGGIDPQNDLVDRNGLKKKTFRGIAFCHLSIFLDSLLPPAQSVQDLSHLQPRSKIARLLGTVFLKMVEGLAPFPF